MQARYLAMMQHALFVIKFSLRVIAYLAIELYCPNLEILILSLMKPVDINPNDEWINMAMAGISPQICILQMMKSAYRSVMFYIGQKELEMQYKMNRIVAQCRQKCETMQEKFSEKLEQVHTAYQKMAKRQKRKLDEMYDQLRSEYQSMKRSAIQPANSFFARNEPDLFSNPAVNMMDNRDPIRKDWSVFSPGTPVPREDIWPARQNSSNSGPFDISSGSPAKQADIPVRRGTGAHPAFGNPAANPSMTLRNLIISPIKRPQLNRNRSNLFT
ncbi:hypothetical protein V6N13_117519 [Hibiscus sabdariffa]